MARMRFMSIMIDNLTMEEAIDKMDQLVQQKKASYVVTPNVDHMVQLEKDKEFRKCYQEASLVLTDGKPLLWISKLYRRPIKEKVSGSDLFPKLCELAQQKDYTMYFLGAAEGVADKAAENLTKRYPGLKIVGTYSPEYGFEKEEQKIKEIVELVREAKPDILIVALGTPKQEKFIYHNRKELKVPLMLGLGASLDFEAGTVKRAPKWMSGIGLEWFYRLSKEPKRMFKRYIINDAKIIVLFFKYLPKRRKDENTQDRWSRK